MNVAKPIREGFVADESVDDTIEIQPPQPQPQPRPQPQPEQQPKRAAPPPHMEDPPDPVDQFVGGKDKWPMRVRLLYKPIPDSNGNLVDTLEFRQPRGGDINRYGNPCRINQEGDVVIDERKMHYIMSALSGILPPMLEAMDPRDWNSCAYRLRDFFLPDLRAWL